MEKPTKSTQNHAKSQKVRGHSPSNRSLERGIEILRAFRPGSEVLGNGDIAERTGLSRATVSRLTQTLVGTGYLERDPVLRAYRLGAPVLSLAHSMRNGSSLLAVATPLMLETAVAHKINVGMAVRDRDEMMYLESVRYSARVSLRKVVSGQRVPIELTSLGRAWLAVAPAEERDGFLAQVRARRAEQWPKLKLEMQQAIANVRRDGYCVATWQPEVVALATPILVEGRFVCVLNVSLTTAAQLQTTVLALKKPLLDLAKRISIRLRQGRHPEAARSF
jgi:DNA-binding IclR family transcriptional regulator